MDDLGSSVLSQAVAVRLLESVDAVTALRRGQVEARFEAMSKALTRLLPDWKWRKPAGGLTLWVRIPRGNASELAQVAARHGVSVLPGPICSPTNGFGDHLRLAFVPEPEEIREGIERLARAWAAYAPAKGARAARVLV